MPGRHGRDASIYKGVYRHRYSAIFVGWALPYPTGKSSDTFCGKVRQSVRQKQLVFPSHVHPMLETIPLARLVVTIQTVIFCANITKAGCDRGRVPDSATRLIHMFVNNVRRGAGVALPTNSGQAMRHSQMSEPCLQATARIDTCFEKTVRTWHEEVSCDNRGLLMVLYAFCGRKRSTRRCTAFESTRWLYAGRSARFFWSENRMQCRKLIKFNGDVDTV